MSTVGDRPTSSRITEESSKIPNNTLKEGELHGHTVETKPNPNDYRGEESSKKIAKNVLKNPEVTSTSEHTHYPSNVNPKESKKTDEFVEKHLPH